MPILNNKQLSTNEGPVNKIALILALISGLAVNSFAGGGTGLTIQSVLLQPTDAGSKFFIAVGTAGTWVTVERSKVGTLAYDQYFNMALSATTSKKYVNVYYLDATNGTVTGTSAATHDLTLLTLTNTGY
jgi:hypothetical protein